MVEGLRETKQAGETSRRRHALSQLGSLIDLLLISISQSKVQTNDLGLHGKERQERRIYQIVEGYRSTTRLNCVVLR
jgi:hypothetical protein